MSFRLNYRPLRLTVSQLIRNIGFAVPSTACLLLLASPAVRASDIAFLDTFKNIAFEQTGNGNSLAVNGYFYSADLITNTPNPYTTVTMTYPGPGSPLNLPQVSPMDYGTQSGFFATQGDMDAAFPFGTYIFSSDTGDSASYDYTADDYAQSNPFLTGTDFTDLQGVNATQDFTVHFNPDIPGSTATNSIIFFTIFDNTTSTQAFDGGFLPATTTSLLIPANTLTPGDSYSFDLDYSNRDIVAGGGTSDFPPEIAFDVRTDGTFTAAPATTPEPSTFAIFGIGLLAAGSVRRRALKKAE